MAVEQELLQGQNSEYRVFDFIASGGFASVYFGRDMRNNVSVAIKRLHPHLSTQAEVVERFEREANTVRGLIHHNIVRMLDRGRDGKGVPFLVMEWVTGNTVGSLLKERGPFQPAEAADVACQALDGLEAAWQQRRVVHRDIKPANLMVDANGNVKVMDFGVAKEFDMATLVGTAGLIGTPAYMAPEQLDAQPLDCRVDIYAMGITLYQMIAGAPPFRGPSLMDYQRQHMREEPPPLAGVDHGLWMAIGRALAKQPDERYRTPSEMIQALMPYAAGAGMLTEARPHTSPGRGAPSYPTQQSYPPTPYPVTPATPAPYTRGAADTAYVGETQFSASGPSVAQKPAASRFGSVAMIAGATVAGMLLVVALGAWFFVFRPSPSAPPSPTAGPLGQSSVATPVGGTSAGQGASAVLFSESLTDLLKAAMPRASGDPSKYGLDYVPNVGYVIERRNSEAPNPIMVAVPASPSGSYDNAVLAIDASLTDTEPGHYIALSCRDPDGTQGYQLRFTPSAARVALFRNNAGRVTQLATGPAPSDSGRLELACQGSTITARLNGADVTTATDTGFPSGGLRLGVGADADAKPTTGARFRNLQVTRP